MVRRRREAESDSAMPSAEDYSIIFVDTSLDTRLAMQVSGSDTVLDFKRKLSQEHANCFSNNGEIQIHSLKVKCEGNFYHLPDSMLVCSALHGVKGNFFISADVSGSLECYINQKTSECDTRDQCGVMSSGANKILALTTLPDGVPEEDIVSAMTRGQKVEKYSDRTSEIWRNDSIENSLGTISPAKKKRKLKDHEVVLHSPTLEDRCTQFHASGEETLQPVLAGCKIGVGEETPKIMPDCMEETAEDVVVRCAPSNLKCSGVVEGASIAATTADASKQKKIKKRRKNMLSDQVDETTLSSSNYCKEDKNFFDTANSPGKVNLSKLSGIPEDGQCDNNIRASCPAKGTHMKELDTCHLTLKVENLNRCSEFKVKGKSSSAINNAHKIDGKDKETDQPDIYEEQKVSSQSHDQVLLQPEKIGSLDEHEAHGNTMESFPADGEHSDDGLYLTIAVPNLDLNLLNDPETIKTNSILPIAKPDMDVGTKEDRKLFFNQEIEMNKPEAGFSIMEPTLPSRSIHTPGVPDYTHYNHDKKKNKTKKSAGKIQDTSYGESEAQKAIGYATINESDYVKLTQTMEDVGICEQNKENKGHNSVGDCLLVPSISEKENQGNSLESNQAQNSIEIVRILPIAKADMDVGRKKDRKLLVDHKIGMNQPEAGISIMEPTLPSRLIHTSGAHDDTHNNHDMKKKRKTRKSSGKIYDSSYEETEAQKARGDDGLHHDSEVMLQSSNKASGCTDSELKSNEARVTTKLLEGVMVEGRKASRGNKRKQSVKKSPGTAMDHSDMEPANNGTGDASAVLLCSPADHFRKETAKGENLLFHKVMNVQTRTLDDSAAFSERKVGDVTINESDSMKLTQTMEDVGICEQRMKKKGHNSAGDCLTVPSVSEKENQGNNLESNRAQNSTEIVSILPIAKADMDVGTKKDRVLLVNHEIWMNQPEAGVSIMEPTLPSRLIHTSGADDDTHDTHHKKMKKKTKKSAGKIHDTSYGENETQKAIGDVGLHHGSEVVLPSSSKASECTDSELKSNEARFTTKLLDRDMVEELKASRGHWRKQSVKKSHNTAMNNSDMEPANNGTSGSSTVLIHSPTDHFPEESGKGENLSFHKVKDVQRKMLDDSAAYSARKVCDATINESDAMKLTQTMVDVGICEQRMKKKGHNSAGDCLTVPSVGEKENQGNNMESNQSQNSIKIVAKKKKKGHRIASDCLENIPLKDQEVVVEAYPTVENANNALEKVDQHVDSQVFSNKSEEQLGEIHFTAASFDNLVRHGEDKDEGVNFNYYFLPGQKQDKVAYVDKVKEATKSSEEMKSVRKVKKPGLPSVSTSTESHNLAKLSENKDRKDTSRVRCFIGKKDGDFVLTSKVSDNGILDSSPTETRAMTTRKKHKENTVASLFTKDTNMPLAKTYLERSGMSSGNGGNKRQPSGLNVSDKVVMNTPRKNSLFERVGSLFQDCSGESSDDENQTANSDASTRSPSDSSSQSGCSAGESDLSQASARNRSNDAQGRITHEKNNAKLDLSASNEVTLDMILRSSKRFKKAKLTTVSQNELEQTDSQIEFVPDSQPINK